MAISNLRKMMLGLACTATFGSGLTQGASAEKERAAAGLISN
ncbi:hypothetical protein [Phaeobacter sp. HF9A]|nr:hypothetical protein [Phaeobacter sp. HF9A]